MRGNFSRPPPHCRGQRAGREAVRSLCHPGRIDAETQTLHRRDAETAEKRRENKEKTEKQKRTKQRRRAESKGRETEKRQRTQQINKQRKDKSFCAFLCVSLRSPRLCGEAVLFCMCGEAVLFCMCGEAVCSVCAVRGLCALQLPDEDPQLNPIHEHLRHRPSRRRDGLRMPERRLIRN